MKEKQKKFFYMQKNLLTGYIFLILSLFCFFCFSAFGKVTTITEQPIYNPVHVEAISLKCSNHQVYFLNNYTFAFTILED